jgi:hypothetical protein
MKKKVVSDVQMKYYGGGPATDLPSGSLVFVACKTPKMVYGNGAFDDGKNVYSPEAIAFFLGVQRAYLKPRMERLYEVTDWLPNPKGRKLAKKLVADQDAHINELVDKGQLKAAKWTKVWTWVLLGWYCTMHLVSGVSQAIKGRIAG